MPIKTFIKIVDYTKNIGNWNDRKAADNVVLACTGKARRWVELLMEEENAVLQSWDALKVEMKDRFQIAATMAEKAEVVRGLKQRQDESVLDFFDRCKAAQYIIVEGGPAVNDDNKAMHDFSFNAQVQLHFVQGLRTPIQSRVINSGEETLAGVKNAALRAEKSLAPYQTAKDKPAKGVEINEAEVEAVQQGEARSNPFAEYLCHFCKKKGHIQKYCHTRKQQKAQMVPNPYKKGDAKKTGTSEVEVATEEPPRVESVDVYQLFTAGRFGNKSGN